MMMMADSDGSRRTSSY